jgi:hypothetical protein
MVLWAHLSLMVSDCTLGLPSFPFAYLYTLFRKLEYEEIHGLRSRVNYLVQCTNILQLFVHNAHPSITYHY